ncbi:uncharacterized protein K444DRAFT_642363 [Hyaloscypha bicolor E]|uniref:Uncharacterized protein n=1 Tax=Hyaloscypha bicolor E TaxID=1095630 RepID=A0A2J6TDY1_9HELO|nr:uncharacterized protein K444DRAFT_642363 [Hyaloscypha bicolor E]PMD61213.1 hypothetical protein K444DRAFT_642363 [Hyaloscypha bicolor E]
MVGHLANRAQFELIIPSTHTSVEAKFNHKLVPGVSWHSGRIFSTKPELSFNETLEAFLVELRSQMKLAVKSVCHAKIDYFVMCMSACSQSFPAGDQQVVDFFTHIRCEVTATFGFKCPTTIPAGTNLLAVKASAELEVELGKSVIAISTATVWHAYGMNEIKDQISG